jgi:hypothetical protein
MLIYSSKSNSGAKPKRSMKARWAAKRKAAQKK